MSLAIPITLAHHVFPQVSIITNPNFQATGEPTTAPPIESALTVGELDGGTNQFVIELYVKVDAGNNPRIPYSVEIVCAAQAVLTGGMPNGESPNRAIAEIGHRLLFPAIRELILSLTARQPWGQFSIGLGVLKPANPAPDTSDATTAAKPKPRKVHSKAAPRKIAAAAAATATAKPAPKGRITIRRKPRA